MAGEGTFATTVIITKGLTCASIVPCKSGIITSAFSLYCTDFVPKSPSAGGGPYPGAAWNKLFPGEVKNFYQPVPPEYYLVPKETEEELLRRYKPLKITFNMGDIHFEKDYMVPENKRKIVVKAFNFMDVTHSKVKIVVNYIKKIAAGVNIVVRNLKLRNK